MTYADLLHGARAGIYARISKDDEGRALGVARQTEDCTALCERYGYLFDPRPWTEGGDLYVDNDISASTLSSKRRPAFEALIAAVKAGRYKVVVAYSNSRLTRRPAELINLINLHNETGVEFNTVASGSTNLSTADGRAVALTIAVWDAAEAERTSERTKRKLQERIDLGLPHHGIDYFGYFVSGGWYEVDERYRALIAAAYREWSSGHKPMTTLAAEWNEAGVPSMQGGRWTDTAVRRVLDQGFAAGLIRRHSKPSRSAALESFDIWKPAAHEAIIDIDTWRAYYQRRVRNNANPRKRSIGRARAYTGLVTCALCDDHSVIMRAWHRVKTNRDVWRCPRWQDSKAHEYLDAYESDIDEVVLAWLEENLGAGEDVDARVRHLAKMEAATGEINRLKIQLGELEAKRESIIDLMVAKALSPADGVKRREAVEADIAGLTAAIDQAEAALAEVGTDRHAVFVNLRQHWREYSHAGRQEALALVIKRIVVHPPTKAGSRWGKREQRIEIIPA